ncbi:MAG: hypothetical protein EAZ40_06395, partial [Rhodobacterales bacterium]
MIPATYEQWRHCIQIDCGIELEPRYIQACQQALDGGRSDEAQRFARLYGQAHLRRVLDWFERAGRE